MKPSGNRPASGRDQLDTRTSAIAAALRLVRAAVRPSLCAVIKIIYVGLFDFDLAFRPHTDSILNHEVS